MKRLVWLASYPKSGNTWMRMLFAAFQKHPDQPFELKDAFKSTRSEVRRSEFEKIAGKSELSELEIDRLREAVQISIAQAIKPPVLLKTHNARVMHNGFPMIRRELTLGAIYIVRNPLDVADSVADHWGVSIDEAIAMMNNRRNAIGGGQGDDLVKQYLESWSQHVLTWCHQRAFPVHVVRYEDLLSATEFTFRNVLTFLGWQLDEQRIRQAIELTQFDSLRSREETSGFAERSKKSTSGTFFRRGQSGHWREILTSAQANLVIEHHGLVMRRFGYVV
ncbi:MAG: sulfotransferase domain-containing protein [Pirellulaceae bacterium]